MGVKSKSANMRAILLINTGSPKSLETKEVRNYLTDFLTDRRIIGLPQPFRNILVHGIIAPSRAPKSRDKYAQIWRPEGSPLQILTEALATRIESESGIATFVAMRYNRGSLEGAYQRITTQGFTEVVLVPLFPHYAMSSYESAVAHAMEVHQQGSYPFALHCVAPYFSHPLYIEALLEQVERFATPDGHLLFSYHGIPLYQNKAYAGIPQKDYPYQCGETTRLVTTHPRFKAMNLSYEICYQSRFGHNRWLTPTLESRMKALAKEGKKHVSVICPSFVCDCLETSWEVGIDLKEQFAKLQLTLIECPNDSLTMANCIIDQVNHHTTEAIEWTKP